MLLNELNLVNYMTQFGADDPGRPMDTTWGVRLCLASEWALFGYFPIWLLAQMRLKIAENEPIRGGWSVWLAWPIAAIVTVAVARRWLNRPFTGEHFVTFDGWDFGLAWAFLAAAFAFSPTKERLGLT